MEFIPIPQCKTTIPPGSKLVSVPYPENSLPKSHFARKPHLFTISRLCYYRFIARDAFIAPPPMLNTTSEPGQTSTSQPKSSQSGSSTSSTTPSGSQPSGSVGGKRIPAKAFVGIILGGVVFALAFIGTILFLVRRRRRLLQPALDPGPRQIDPLRLQDQ